MFLAGRRFSRNSASPGIFQDFLAIGTVFVLRNVRTFCTFVVWPPAVAIRDLLVFLGVWGTERNLAAAQGPKQAKNAEKVDFLGLGGRSGQNTRGLSGDCPPQDSARSHLPLPSNAKP